MSNKVLSFDGKLLSHIKRGKMAEAISVIQNMPNAHKLVDNYNFTLLHYGADAGNGGIAKYLIELGSDVDAQDAQGRTPLMLAVHEERVTTIRVLLESNANIHVTNVDGKSALHMVVHGSMISQNTIRAFLHKLKKETSRDSRLIAQKLRVIDCPLRIAVFLEEAEVTRLMLDAGDCEIDDPDPELGDTALHVAVRLQSLENVKILIEYGANLNAQTAEGRTPLFNLEVNKDDSFEILKSLLDGGAMMFTEKDGEKRCQIGCILEHADRKTIHLLVQHDIDLRAVDEYGSTVLHYLARNGNGDVFDELEGKNFDVNARNNASYTPLLMVTGNVSSLKFLVRNGADVNASRNGVTPLAKVFQMAHCSGGSDECLNILLQHGADPQSVFFDDSVDRALRENALSPTFGLLHPLLAHLALLEDTGTPIAELVRSKIDGHEFLKSYYNLCVSELDSMKRATVWESITKYKLLRASDKQLALYARQRQFRSIVSSNAFYFESCYHIFASDRVEEAVVTAELWENSTTCFCDLLKLPYEKYYDVIENMIISYLSERDMRNLCLLASA